MCEVISFNNEVQYEVNNISLAWFLPETLHIFLTSPAD